MSGDRSPADADLAMNTTLDHQQRKGRFGRAVTSDDARAAGAAADGPDERFTTLDYVVDPTAVADAIVERLLAGRTLRLPSRR